MDERDALLAAYAAALRTIAIADPKTGYDAATSLAAELRSIADDAAAVRARLADQVYREEGLTLAQLGERLGLSLTRAAELVQAGRNVRAGKTKVKIKASPAVVAVAAVIPERVRPVEPVSTPPAVVPVAAPPVPDIPAEPAVKPSTPPVQPAQPAAGVPAFVAGRRVRPVDDVGAAAALGWKRGARAKGE